MNSRDARTTMLTEVRINTMLTILGTNHIETLDEFNHADPDDYGSMYQALGHLYKVSDTINAVPGAAGVSQEGRIAAHVERDLTSDLCTVQRNNMQKYSKKYHHLPAPVVKWVTSAEYAGLVSRIVERNQHGADINLNDALKNVRIKWDASVLESNNVPAF